MQVNLDEIITHLRELLCMNRAQLLKEIKTVPESFRIKAKKSELIAFALEQNFNSKARPPVLVGQGHIGLAFGKITE